MLCIGAVFVFSSAASCGGRGVPVSTVVRLADASVLTAVRSAGVSDLAGAGLAVSNWRYTHWRGHYPRGACEIE